MDGERRCGGSAFQIAAPATWKLVDQAVFLLKGQACHNVQMNEDMPGQGRQRLGCRRC